jgi:hypothetical protein
VKSGDESDVDCGGSCLPCAVGACCRSGEDCLSGGCVADAMPAAGACPATCGHWVRLFGSLQPDPNDLVDPAIVTFDPQGDIVAGATFKVGAGISVGGPPLGPTDTTFLFATTRTGAYTWSTILPAGTVFGGLAAGTGSATAAGTSPGGDFGGGTIAPAGPPLDVDVFVARYTSAGTYAWAKLFGGADVDDGRGVAVDAAGNVAVVGDSLSPSIAFGGTVLLNPGAKRAGFVAYLDATGSPVWAKGLGGALGDSTAAAVAFDGAGNVLVAGALSGTADFGPGCAPLGAAGELFVAKLAPSGACLWAETGGGAAATGIGVDASGDVLVAGTVGKLDVTLGGANVPSMPARTWIAKLHGGDGTFVWANGVPGGALASYQYPRLAVDGGGNAVIAGAFSEASLDFGGKTATNVGPGTSDAYVAVLAASDGGALFARSVGTVGIDAAHAVAVSPTTGSVLLSGVSNSGGTEVTLAEVSLLAPSGVDLFIVSLGRLP